MEVLFINEFKQNEIKEMNHIPRIGDTVPLFFEPYPKVKNVIWFPELIEKEMIRIDVVIKLG